MNKIAIVIPVPRRRLLRALPVALGVASLPALSGCTHASQRLDAESDAIPHVDLTAITRVDAIAALVPGAIRQRGTLINGAALNYAPGEFVGDADQAVGFDIDIFNAIAKVLGLAPQTQSAVFAQIIPSVGSKYDLGISSFTINEDRLKSVTMVSYFRAGMSYAVRTGNPYGIDPAHLCGKQAAHQVGTYMDDVVVQLDAECRKAGGRGVVDQPYVGNDDAATAVAGGKADILLADSPVVAYAVSKSRGTLETIGDIQDSALNGIVVSKQQPQLAEAICKAVQHLIDSGHMKAILQAWGNESGMITTSEVNPKP